MEHVVNENPQKDPLTAAQPAEERADQAEQPQPAEAANVPKPRPKRQRMLSDDIVTGSHNFYPQWWQLG